MSDKTTKGKGLMPTVFNHGEDMQEDKAIDINKLGIETLSPKAEEKKVIKAAKKFDRHSQADKVVEEVPEMATKGEKMVQENVGESVIEIKVASDQPKVLSALNNSDVSDSYDLIGYAHTRGADVTEIPEGEYPVVRLKDGKVRAIVKGYLHSFSARGTKATIRSRTSERSGGETVTRNIPMPNSVVLSPETIAVLNAIAAITSSSIPDIIENAISTIAEANDISENLLDRIRNNALKRLEQERAVITRSPNTDEKKDDVAEPTPSHN